MKVQMREIIQAIPALSKVTGGDLSLQLAYQLKKALPRCKKRRISSRSSARRSLINMARRRRMAPMLSKRNMSRRQLLNWRHCWIWR